MSGGDKSVIININKARLSNQGATPQPTAPSVQVRDEDTVEVESSDIVRVILQFLKENNLQRTFQILQEESGVYLGCVPNVEKFVQDVCSGKLEVLLDIVGDVDLPSTLLFDVFEHIALEIVEQGGPKQLAAFMKSTPVFEIMKHSEAMRVSRLNLLGQKERRLNKEEIWGESIKLKRRKQIAKRVANELQVAPSSRLLALLNLSIKMQKAQGLISSTTKLNLLRGFTASDRETCALPPNNVRHVVELPSKKRRIFSSAFSPDGHTLITGDSSGEILAWSWLSGQLRTDLLYQKEEYFMFHETSDGKPLAITAVAFASDGKLATGDSDGNLKMWEVSSGSLLRGPMKIHAKAINSIAFHPSEPQVLTASNDGTAKIVYPVSGTVAKTFDAHDGFVNCALFDGSKGSTIVTACSDGYLRVFSVKTGSVTAKIALPHSEGKGALSGNALQRIIRDRRDNHQYFVCPKGKGLHCIDSTGNLIRSYSAPGQAEYADIATSPSSEWLIGQSEFGDLDFFNPTSGELVTSSPRVTNGCGGIEYHPLRNVVVCWGADHTFSIIED